MYDMTLFSCVCVRGRGVVMLENKKVTLHLIYFLMLHPWHSNLYGMILLSQHRDTTNLPIVLYMLCMCLLVGVKRSEWKPAPTSSRIWWKDKGREYWLGNEHLLWMYLVASPHWLSIFNIWEFCKTVLKPSDN